MQSTAIAFSPSLSLSSRKFPVQRFNSLSLSQSKRHRFANRSVSSSLTNRRFSSINCSLRNNGWIYPKPENDPTAPVVRATSDSAGPAEVPKSKNFSDTLVFGSLFGLWYLFNNIYNKQVLKAFHYPMRVTLVQFAVGTVLVTLMWTLNLYKRPKVSGAQLLAILPPALVHTMGNLKNTLALQLQSTKNSTFPINYLSTIYLFCLFLSLKSLYKLQHTHSFLSDKSQSTFIASSGHDHSMGPTSRSDSELKSMFESWIVKHDKAYNSIGETERRFEIFKDSLRFVDEHNSGDCSCKFGLNQFSDLTHEEYQSLFAGCRAAWKTEVEESEAELSAFKAGEKLPGSVD